MQPLNRYPSPIFMTDEDYDRDFEKLLQSVKKTLYNYGRISMREIQSNYHIDKETANKVMDLIKKEFFGSEK